MSTTEQSGDPANGMVMDFSEIKSLAQRHLVDLWDHSFLVYAGDTLIVDFSENAARTTRRWCLTVSRPPRTLSPKPFSVLDAAYRDGLRQSTAPAAHTPLRNTQLLLTRTARKFTRGDRDAGTTQGNA